MAERTGGVTVTAKLTPLELPAQLTAIAGGYAMISCERMAALAFAMPDSKSAVLFCLTWKAARQERMNLGQNAGQCVARISASKLASITGFSLRTVQWALAALKAAELIELDYEAPGRTNVYRLNLPPTSGQENTDADSV